MAHGATVRAESRPGSGTSIYFRFKLIIENYQNNEELERRYLEVNGIENDTAFDSETDMALERNEPYRLMLPCIEKIRGFDGGADDYIVKILNSNELFAQVKAHISRYERLKNKQRKSNEIQIGSIVI